MLLIQVSKEVLHIGVSLNEAFITQQLSHLLWRGKVHYCAHSSWPLDTILIQRKAGYAIFPFLKFYSNIISPPRKFFIPLNSFPMQYYIYY
jgi:hypothetical protein